MPPSQASVPHPPHLTPLGHHWTELLVLYSSFPLAVHFTHGSICMSVLLSQFVPPSLSHPVYTVQFLHGRLLIFGFFPKSFSSMELTPSFWQEAFQDYYTLSFKEVSSPSPNLSDSAPCTTVAAGNSLGGAWCIFPLWREKLPGPFYSKGF